MRLEAEKPKDIPDVLREKALDIARGWIHRQRIENLHELEKSPFEQQTLDALNTSIASLTKRLGLPGLSVTEQQVHILDPRVIPEEVNIEGEGACCLDGHIYIQRNDVDPYKFVRLLAHESAHAISYLEHTVHFSPAKKEGEDAEIIPVSRRVGFDFAPRIITDPDLRKFQAFNEAATDLLSFDIRNEPAFLERMPPDMDRGNLLQVVYPHSLILHKILKAVATEEPDTTWRENLHRDLFRGTWDTLRALGKKQKGFVKRWAELKNDWREYITLANETGYKECIPIIRTWAIGTGVSSEEIEYFLKETTA